MIDATDIQQFCMMLKKETKPHISKLHHLEVIYRSQLKLMQSCWCLGVYVAMRLWTKYLQNHILYWYHTWFICWVVDDLYYWWIVVIGLGLLRPITNSFGLVGFHFIISFNQYCYFIPIGLVCLLHCTMND